MTKFVYKGGLGVNYQIGWEVCLRKESSYVMTLIYCCKCLVYAEINFYSPYSVVIINNRT
jgi:hypothetical protein